MVLGRDLVSGCFDLAGWIVNTISIVACGILLNSVPQPPRNNKFKLFIRTK